MTALLHVVVAVASLLSCLYQLKAENRTLEERIATMTARRDRLLAVNARLSVPLASPGSNSHAAEQETQTNSLDNGLMDDATSRHGKSPRSTAAPVSNYTPFRVIYCPMCYSYTHANLTAILPGEYRLSGFPLGSPSLFSPNLHLASSEQ